MYLKELYQHHKGWFTVVIVFAFVQVINNVRQDIAISPVYAYGMYSAYISPRTLHQVFEIDVNGKILQPKDFSPQQWDKIVLPLRYYANGRCNNINMYGTDIKRLLMKVGIAADSSKFIYSIDENRFNIWYRSYLSSIIKEKIDFVQIHSQVYKYESSFYKIQSEPFKQLCE